MRYLGIDYGTKKIGTSLSDESGMLAFPHTTLENNERLINAIKKITTEYKVEAIVVGDPKTISGADNPLVEDVSIFIMRLEKEFGTPIHKEGEAFSSFEAARFAPKGKNHEHSAAAAIILQRFLDMHRSGENTPVSDTM